jgi:hypothetical protein
MKHFDRIAERRRNISELSGELRILASTETHPQEKLLIIRDLWKRWPPNQKITAALVDRAQNDSNPVVRERSIAGLRLIYHPRDAEDHKPHVNRIFRRDTNYRVLKQAAQAIAEEGDERKINLAFVRLFERAAEDLGGMLKAKRRDCPIGSWDPSVRYEKLRMILRGEKGASDRQAIMSDNYWELPEKYNHWFVNGNMPEWANKLRLLAG